MALRFGQLFDDLNAGFQAAINKVKKFKNSFNEEVTSSFDALNAFKQQLKALQQQATQTAQNIQNYKTQIAKLEAQRLTASQEEAAAIEQQIAVLKERMNAEIEFAQTLEKDVAVTLKAITEAEKKYSDSLDKRKVKIKSASQISEDYTKQIEELNKKIGDGILTQQEWQDSLSELTKQMAKNLAISTAASAFKADNPSDSLTEGLEAGLDLLADELAATLGPEVYIIAEGVKIAAKQVYELNKALVGMTRSTGGLVTATKLGYDEYGNATKGVQSLKASLVTANVTMEEFSRSMQSLFSDGFGQTIGVTQDLNKAQKDLQEYGIEAAKQLHLYGAEIGPAVRGMVQDFGFSIGEATGIMKEGALQARSLGLSVSAFAQNMADVASLAGEIYFATREEMVKMATVATKLGTSVKAISKGIVEMNGITGLFQKQQQLAALGLGSVAKNAAQIYALRSQGKGAEASQLELASFVKDLKKQGMIDESGNIKEQGRATLKAAGVDEEQIKALNRMAKLANTGVSLEKIGNPELLTARDKIKLEREEKANKPIDERFNQMFGMLKQALIDPIAKNLGPAIERTFALVEPLFGILTDIINTLDLIIDPVKTALNETLGQIIGMFTDILNPIKRVFDKLFNALQPISSALGSFGKFMQKALFLPFRMLSSLIGGIVDIFGGVIEFLGNILAPIFNVLSEVFDEMSGWIDDIIDWFQGLFGDISDMLGEAGSFIGDALGSIFSVLGDIFSGLIDILGGVFGFLGDMLGPIFKALFEAISFVLSPFKMLWDALNKFYDWIAKFLRWGNDEENLKSLTPNDWADILGVSGVPTPESPSAKQQIGEQIKAQSAAIQATQEALDEAKVAETFGAKTTPIKNNITVNTSGIFDNKQQVQSVISGK